MDRFKKILFVADNSKGEQAALARTLELAADNKASLCLLDVIEPFPDMRFLRAGMKKMPAVKKELVDGRTKALKALLAETGSNKKSPRTSVKIREGKRDIEIIRQVLEGKHDLVVKVSSGQPRLSGMRLGTLDMSLLRKCPCPVLIMKPAKRIHHSKILAAVDLTHLPEEKHNLDREIMDLAAAQARLEVGRLHVLHAWHLPYEHIMEGEARVQFYKTVPQMLKELRRVEKQHLNAMAALYPDANPRVHMVKGLPEKVIPAFAEKNRVDLVVMGTLARGGVEGLLIGNTAEKILSKIDCSVLALKPKDFKCPIKP